MFHGVSTDVLRNAARFARRHPRLADKIHERCFAVVDVAHEGDDRRARFQFVLGHHDRGFGWRGDHRFGFVHAGPGLALLLFENKTVLLAHLRSDSRLDRLVQIGENIRLHQVFDDHEGLDAEGRGEVFHHDRRLDVDDLLAVLG